MEEKSTLKNQQLKYQNMEQEKSKNPSGLCSEYWGKCVHEYLVLRRPAVAGSRFPFAVTNLGEGIAHLESHFPAFLQLEFR